MVSLVQVFTPFFLRIGRMIFLPTWLGEGGWDVSMVVNLLSCHSLLLVGRDTCGSLFSSKIKPIRPLVCDLFQALCAYVYTPLRVSGTCIRSVTDLGHA